MSVRKTESRLPAGLQSADLGEAVTSADGRCTLVSFITAPLAVGRENTYVVFVTDTALAASIKSYEWSFTENESPPIIHTTNFGEISYIPSSLGNLTVSVRIFDNSNAEKAKLVLPQSVFVLNIELETLIDESLNEPGPGIGNLDVARELINDHNPFYQGLTLRIPEEGDGFKRFIFSIISDGALQRTALSRKGHLEELAMSLNNDVGSFPELTASGFGVCNIRLSLLAMTLPGLLAWEELPEKSDMNAMANGQLRQKLGELDENTKIDLFNFVRFPKSNITHCGRIIEHIRNKYFGNTNFNDVLTGMSGTRAIWIVNHFSKGPLLTT